jgi:transcriptional regulator with XRE-family HTH domain
MEIQELGARLRARRVAAGETIAAVAMRAGLSVPYIANLENGRGNPTLTALSALSHALGADLRIGLAELADNQPPEPAAAAPPAALARFTRSPRFAAAADRLAERAGLPAQLQRERLVAAMAAVAAATPGSLSELDCHRILDAITLIARNE